MKIILHSIFIVLILLFNSLFAQIQFQRAIGGANDEIAGSILQIPGGYMLAGSTSSFGEGLFDFYIIKMDSAGTVLWTKTIGGNRIDIAEYIIKTTDGGFAIAGYSSSFGSGNYDMVIVKLDASGSLQWSKFIGDTASQYAHSIIQTSDGGYMLAGETTTNYYYSDFFIVKLDANGNVQWNKIIGNGGSFFSIYSMIQNNDGGYTLTGTGGSSINADINIIRLNSSGTVQWIKNLSGTGHDYGYSITRTFDGGIAVAGAITNGSNIDMIIIKLDSNGSLQWDKSIGGANVDEAYSLKQTRDRGYIITGETFSFGLGSYGDVYIVKVDSNGNNQWSKRIGGISSDGAKNIVETNDDGYALIGITSSYGAGNDDIYIVKFDANGNTCGNTNVVSSTNITAGTVNSEMFNVVQLNLTVSSPVLVIGTGGVVTSLCTFIAVKNLSEIIPNSYSLYQNYPNPFNPSTKIKFDVAMDSRFRLKSGGNDNHVTLIIYDLLGKAVATLVNESLKPGTYEVEFNGDNFPNGVYFAKLVSGDFSETRKMILMK